jgi:uncharacterized protein YndB with AHSA1/START domain
MLNHKECDMAGAAKPTFVYVTYIAAPPEKVWRALTEPDLTEKYWFGFRVRANGNAGEHMTAQDPTGKEIHRDVILVSEPPRRLVYAWRPLYDEFKHERPSRVTLDIAPMQGQVRLTVIHDDFDEGSAVFEKISEGWPSVLSSLKSYLETGRALSSPACNPPAAKEAAA